jgi:ketosteroid isomerase-like protein
MKIIQSFLIVISSTLLFSCQSIKDSQVDNVSDEFFQELVKTKYVEPFKAGNIDIWLQSFDDDAIALHNRRPADKGKEAIKAFGEIVHSYFDIQQYDVKVTNIRRSENWVYTVGEYTTLFVNKSDGIAPWGKDTGKFVLLWELQEDNQWRVILDMGNSNGK